MIQHMTGYAESLFKTIHDNKQPFKRLLEALQLCPQKEEYQGLPHKNQTALRSQ